jgi:hypothetical protein
MISIKVYRNIILIKMGNCINTVSIYEICDDEMVLFAMCGSGRIVFLEDFKEVQYDNLATLTLIGKDRKDFVFSFWNKETAIKCFLELREKFI